MKTKIGNIKSLLMLILILPLIPQMTAAIDLQVSFPGQPEPGPSPAKYIENLYNFGLALGALLAILMIVIGAIQYVVSEAIPGKEDARERIKSAIWGLVLLGAAVLILGTLNPQLPQLKEPELTAVQTPQPLPPPSGGPPPPPPPPAGCDLTANPMIISSRTDVHVQWTTFNDPESCVASGDWSGEKHPAGGSDILTLDRDTALRLTCFNVGGSRTCSVDIDFLE